MPYVFTFEIMTKFVARLLILETKNKKFFEVILTDMNLELKIK